MPTEPPPSRYRVIERGRRLEVIDTMAGRRPPLAYVPEARAAPTDALPVPEIPAYRPSAPVTAPPPGMIAAPDFLRNVAQTVCGERRDETGVLLLDTARWYDGKGPRTIALDPEGERELALLVIVMLVVAVGAIILAVVGGPVGWVIVFIGLSTLQRGKALATRWLDRLAGV
jgi:hypothetical protein